MKFVERFRSGSNSEFKVVVMQGSKMLKMNPTVIWAAPSYRNAFHPNDVRAKRLCALLDDPLALNCILAADAPPEEYPELDLVALRRVLGST